MKRFLVVVTLVVLPFTALADESALTRREGFMLLWDGIKRPAQEVKQQYDDVTPDSIGYKEISFAARRGLLPDEDRFHPDDTLRLDDALLWLFRTRNVEPIDFDTGDGLGDIIEPEQLQMVLERYPLISLSDPAKSLTREELLSLAAQLDAKLATEVHEFSSYSEKFHGKGTAFGESFNMYDLPAAHRSFPHNTLVKVTNVRNGKSVVVRINDRGPYVVGRNIDLSLAAFLTIEDRSKGIGNATIERLGDSSLVPQTCMDERRARRIGQGIILDDGVPRTMGIGETLSLSANGFFAIQTITHPDNSVDHINQWVSPQGRHTEKETFKFTPTTTGTYEFLFRTRNGTERMLTMEATACSVAR